MKTISFWVVSMAIGVLSKHVTSTGQTRGGEGEDDQYIDACTDPDPCSCRNHDDCGKASFCSLYSTNNAFAAKEEDSKEQSQAQVCLPCSSCSTNDVVDCRAACAECQSSGEDDDCPDGSVCLRHGIKNRYSSCSPCTAFCVDGWLQRNGETCATVCPAQYQCDSHDDCEHGNATELQAAAETADTSISLSQWCTVNHNCRTCGYCWWSAFRFGTIESGGDAAISERWNDTTRVAGYDTPMNMSCPDSCCESEVSPFDGDSPEWVVAPCNGTLVLGAGWVQEEDVTADETPAHFQDRSNHCEVQRRSSPKVAESSAASGLPMTLIFCPGLNPAKPCRGVVPRVFAIWIVDPVNGRAVDWYRPDLYPALSFRGGRSESCFPSAIGIWGYYVVVVVLVLGGCGCVVFLSCRHTRRNQIS